MGNITLRIYIYDRGGIQWITEYITEPIEHRAIMHPDSQWAERSQEERKYVLSNPLEKFTDSDIFRL